MMSRRGTSLAALLAPLALLVPIAGHAETVTVDDAAGDAKAINFGSELGGFFLGSTDEGQPLFLDAPAETATDITRTTITHARRVTVTTHFRDLVDGVDHALEMRVRTPEGRFDLSVGRSADGSTSAQLSPSIVIVDDVIVSARPCRSVRSRYDATAETVTVSFPAACVEKPRWIQVASGATRIQITPIGDGSVNLASWADDAFRPSLSERSVGFSPKVRRG